jgi:hypothetical protein
VQGEQALIAEARHLGFQGWESLAYKGERSMAIWLSDSGSAESRGLSGIKIKANRRIVSGGSAHGGLAVIEHGQQDR